LVKKAKQAGSELNRSGHTKRVPELAALEPRMTIGNMGVHSCCDVMVLMTPEVTASVFHACAFDAGAAGWSAHIHRTMNRCPYCSVLFCTRG
jgi:hypothetical protein